MSYCFASISVSKQERLLFESLAILLECHHDNAEAHMRHCREAAGILRQLSGRMERSMSMAPDSGAAFHDSL